MKLRYFSDIHLEFMKPNRVAPFLQQIPSGEDEICILAGDVGNPFQPNYDCFMKFISQQFRKSFVIPGNHEYYQSSKTIRETNDFMEGYFRQFHNISFLNNSYEVYNNHCFVGTTMWSKITNPRYQINDVYHIPGFDHIQYNQLHAISCEFLDTTLRNHENCVVITHHVPSESLIDVQYKTPRMMPYNQWFYSPMDDLISLHREKITCWIYGHTHTPSATTIHNIPFLCSPIGYPNENQPPFFQTNSIHI
jgi:predicted phosphodiesterase